MGHGDTVEHGAQGVGHGDRVDMEIQGVGAWGHMEESRMWVKNRDTWSWIWELGVDMGTLGVGHAMLPWYLSC